MKIDEHQHLGLQDYYPFRVIRDNNFYRIKNHHSSQCDPVQMFTKAKLKQANIDNILSFCNSNSITELTNAFRRISAATKTTDGWHPRVIPTGNIIFIHQLQ